MYNFNPYMNNNMFASYPSISSVSTNIPRVNGIESAKNYPLAKDSSVLVLDIQAPIVYMISSDSSGFKTIKPFTISEYEPEPEIDTRSLWKRVEAIERRLNNEPDTRNDEQSEKHTSTSRSGKVLNEYDANKFKSDGGNSKLYNE